MELASKRPEPIPVYAEMGSVNPVVLLPQAVSENPTAIAAGLHLSATLGVGQFCTNPGIVLIKKDADGDTLVAAFVEKMKDTTAQVMLNPTIQRAYNDGLERMQTNNRVATLVAPPQAIDNAACLGGAAVFEASATSFLEDKSLSHEIFGPGTTLIRWQSKDELIALLESFEGQLTGTIHATDTDLYSYPEVLPILERKVGRIVYNGFPTGVEVCHSMVHGGPYPATSDGRGTSVGTHAITRFTRLIAYQDSPQSLLPDELKDGNPLGIVRLEDGQTVGAKA